MSFSRSIYVSYYIRLLSTAHGFGVGGNEEYEAHGTCQESTNHFFAFYIPQNWAGEPLGVPPVRNNDMDFAQFAKHARYADAARLSTDQPHFYWQSGVTAEERYRPKDQLSFISRDLPSFSATEENFIMFHPEEQKGIQCRFGERGTWFFLSWGPFIYYSFVRCHLSAHSFTLHV